MKTIRIKFVGFWSDFVPEHLYIYNFLKNYYNVEIVEDADYIICGVFGQPYDYCKYPQIRIMYSGENYIPDLNFVDYAICPYPIVFLDRVVYKPVFFDDTGHFLKLANKVRDYPDNFLDNKIYFANFIASHDSEHNIRGDFFKKLCEYKRVESPGTYLNNMNTNEKLTYTDESKVNFQKKCKFTLCFESTKHKGFITEKIVDAFFADTIPVYYGSETVSEIFNPKAFINCNDFRDFDAIIAYIKELDQNDEKYLQMLREPIFLNDSFPNLIFNNFKQKLLDIFDQPLEKAVRRSSVYFPQKHEKYVLSEHPKVEYEIKFLAESIKQNDSHKIKTEIKSQTKKNTKKLKKLLFSFHKIVPLITENYWIYEIAFPRFMFVFWLFKSFFKKF